MGLFRLNEADFKTGVHNVVSGIAAGTHNGVFDNKEDGGGYKAPILTGLATAAVGLPVPIAIGAAYVGLAKLIGNTVSIDAKNKSLKDHLDSKYFNSLYNLSKDLKDKLAIWCSKIKGSGPFTNSKGQMGGIWRDNWGYYTSDNTIAGENTNKANSKAWFKQSGSIKKDLGTALCYKLIQAPGGKGHYIVYFEFDSSKIESAKCLVFKGDRNNPNNYDVVTIKEWRSVSPSEYKR